MCAFLYRVMAAAIIAGWVNNAGRKGVVRTYGLWRAECCYLEQERVRLHSASCLRTCCWLDRTRTCSSFSGGVRDCSSRYGNSLIRNTFPWIQSLMHGGHPAFPVRSPPWKDVVMMCRRVSFPSYWQLYRYQGVDEKRNTVLKDGCLDSVFWLFFSNWLQTMDRSGISADACS